MNDALSRLLEELAAFGSDHDAQETDHDQRMLNITPETGRLLAILVRVLEARRILEIGTSNGYSTLWLAWAAQATDGHVTTLEQSAQKVALARANFARGGLTDLVTICEGQALDVLAGLHGPFDLIFRDADRENYLTYLDRIFTLLRPGGLLVTDNVISHAYELAAFLDRVKNDPRLESVTLPVGNGEELSYKRP